ncbi:MAG: class I SAM-dependent methyltransferase [Pseudomonadota bacterium]
MGILDDTNLALGRARYVAAQGIRSAWYGAHYFAALRLGSGYIRPGDAPFRAESGNVDVKALRKAFFDLFAYDRANVEAGLYPPPKDLRLRDLASAIQSSRAFLQDVPKVDERRNERRGNDVRKSNSIDTERYPNYYKQNFHYQSDGWLSDESARIYDTQVETLFTGAADAMRRASLAEISREIKGRDQRHIRLLDMACGTGRFLAQTLRAFPKLNAAGLDLSPNYAERARQQVSQWPQVDIVEGAAEAMPIDDDSQDIVVSIYLFHELPPRVRSDVFKDVARILKPGGIFIFADSLQFGDNEGLDPMLEYFPEGFHEPYYKGYLSADLGSDLEKANFTLERTKLAFLTKVQVWRKS